MLERLAPPAPAPAVRERATPRIVFVGSYGRSGSTLLGRALSEAPGTICVGETRYLWSRGLIDNVSCGCGKPFRDCPFWGAVGRHAFGGWENVDPLELSRIDQETNVLRALAGYWAPRLRPRLYASIERYVPVLARVYHAIAIVSGAHTVIEISKDPTFACLVARIPDSDVRMVHLVRDPRAVAYSWTRRRRELSPIAGSQFMPQFRPGETAAKWVAYNLALQALVREVPYRQVTYERFMRKPAAVIRELKSLVGDGSWRPNPPFAEGSVWLGEHHMFSGNPMRSARGWVPFQIDEEWRNELPGVQFAAVSALSWPLARLYGYRLARGAEPLSRDGLPGDD